jgi:hypothetical protein
MGATNEASGSDWRTTGLRMGLISMMAATGMVLAGHAAEATTVTAAPKTQANGGGQGQADGSGQGQADGSGQGLPLDLNRLPGGNSGATCTILDVNVLGVDTGVLSDRALKRDITLVDWSR